MTLNLKRSGKETDNGKFKVIYYLLSQDKDKKE